MYRAILLLSLFSLSQHVLSGFTEGEPCNVRNIAVLHPTHPLWPMYNIKCAYMQNMGNTSWFIYIGKLKEATDIFANNMKLKRIPRKMIASLPNLDLLDVSNNSIRHIHPFTFKYNSKFTTLILTKNRINLPKKRPFLTSQSLTTLYLSENYIKHIPPMAFTKLPALKVLFLNNNKLVFIHPQVFRGLYGLKMLHIGNNLLTLIPPKQVMPPSLVRYITKPNPRKVNEDFEDFV